MKKKCPICKHEVTWTSEMLKQRFPPCPTCGTLLVSPEGKKHLEWCEMIKARYKDGMQRK